ncbi:MAG: flavodoxin-dependent (E)-4-hydroxy-3-methylbut-2-enyl-diphosphate synthase [Phycisphaerae bacterium]|nr:flavodoxin-dependent (E)-4-hydroxy-3-methylbut-2-enyl-diphosphate synthase [Phycisphaerae bacterium]
MEGAAALYRHGQKTATIPEPEIIPRLLAALETL